MWYFSNYLGAKFNLSQGKLITYAIYNIIWRRKKTLKYSPFHCQDDFKNVFFPFKEQWSRVFGAIF